MWAPNMQLCPANQSVLYLTNFGETYTLSEHDFALAEKYRAPVWEESRSNTKSDTFDLV